METLKSIRDEIEKEIAFVQDKEKLGENIREELRILENGEDREPKHGNILKWKAKMKEYNNNLRLYQYPKELCLKAQLKILDRIKPLFDSQQEQMGDNIGHTKSDPTSVQKKSGYVGMPESNETHTPADNILNQLKEIEGMKPEEETPDNRCLYTLDEVKKAIKLSRKNFIEKQKVEDIFRKALTIFNEADILEIENVLELEKIFNDELKKQILGEKRATQK